VPKHQLNVILYLVHYFDFQSDWKSAEEWFQFCHTIDPSHAFPYYMRGKHYRDVGDFAKAFEILEKGAQLQQPQRGLYNQPMYYQCQLKYA
jgi:tetratricopeptide (TPR) repeat protein